MSLINDALRRQEQDPATTTTENPPGPSESPPPPMVPVKPPRKNGTKWVLLLGVGLLICVGLLVGGLWLVYKARTEKRNQVEMAIKHETGKVEQARKVASATARTNPMPPSMAATAVVVRPSPAVVATPAPEKVASPVVTQVVTRTVTQTVLLTQIVTQAAPPLRPWPALKLQAVVCNPPASVALLNGKMMKVDDVLDDVRLLEIGNNSILLLFDGRTNRMELQP